MMRSRPYVSDAIAVLLCITCNSKADADSLEQLIANVRANEELYNNLELTHEYRYTTPRTNGSVSMPTDMSRVLSRSSTIKFVRQADKFRIERFGRVVNTAGKRSANRIRSYDGRDTRLLEQERYANLDKGRRLEGDEFVRPHMLLLQRMKFGVPLSTYLSGDAAVRAHPQSNLADGLSLVVHFEGQSEVRGHPCDVVWVTTLHNGQEHDRWVISLAKDRNLIPISISGYTFPYSNDVSVGDGHVNTWIELSRGVWFPDDIELTAYDKSEVRDHGAQIPIWTTSSKFTNVSLSPSYSDSYFSDVAFPDGVAVYELDNGEISKDYWKGSPGTNESTIASIQWWFVALNILAVVTIVAIIWRKRLSTRHVDKAPT